MKTSTHGKKIVTGKATYYSDLTGKGKGQRQVHPTQADLLAKARAEYNAFPDFNAPIQGPTLARDTGVTSVRLPRYYREELNSVLFGVAPYWSNMFEAFGVIFEKSRELREWLGERCDEVYELNARYDRLLKIASVRGDMRRTDALRAGKVKARGAVVVSAFRLVLKDAGAVFGAEGIPLVLTPATLALRTTKLDIVREFSAQAKKLSWELQKQSFKADRQPAEKRGEKKPRAKNHKRSGDSKRMTAVKEAIVALAEVYA